MATVTQIVKYHSNNFVLLARQFATSEMKGFALIRFSRFDSRIARGDGLLAFKETLILCGLVGFLANYVPVFLAGKMYVKTPIFKRGEKN